MKKSLRLENYLLEPVKNRMNRLGKTQPVLSPAIPDPKAAGTCALTVMTKAPKPGAVKTRLSPPLTPEEGSALNSCFLRDLAAAISGAGDGTQGIACYTPVGSQEIYRDILPRNFQLIPQRSESLSERLINAMHDLFAVGFASVCLINSDSPLVPAAAFAEAANMLAQPGPRLVLGPADDGGYYLIGAKELHPQIFTGIDWSTSRVLEQTLKCAAKLQLPVHLLPVNYDVDDPAGLRRLCRELLGPNETGEIRRAHATEEFLRAIVAREGSDRLCRLIPGE